MEDIHALPETPSAVNADSNKYVFIKEIKNSFFSILKFKLAYEINYQHPAFIDDVHAVLRLGSMVWTNE